MDFVATAELKASKSTLIRAATPVHRNKPMRGKALSAQGAGASYIETADHGRLPECCWHRILPPRSIRCRCSSNGSTNSSSPATTQALEQGFYRDAGLDVTIREGGPDIDVAETVASGKADFGVCNASVLREWSMGRRLVVLAAIFQHSPAVILVPRRADISNVSELRGRTLMDTPGSDEIAAMLTREGVDYAPLPRVAHEGNPRDLLAGRADAMVAYSTNEPFVLEQLGAAYRIFSPEASGIDFYGDNLCASEAEVRPIRTGRRRSGRPA